MVAYPASHSKLPNFGRLWFELGTVGRGGSCGWLEAGLAGQKAPMMNDWLGNVNKGIML